MVTAIVLAGGQKKGLILGQEELLINEAMIQIGEKHMIEYVIQALKGSSYIKEIIVSGTVEKIQKIFYEVPNLVLVQSGETVIESFKNAIMALNTPDCKLLIVTADLPLLTTEAVDYFLKTCFEREGDLFYPVVKKEINDQRYPGVQRTYVNLKDGTFTGGNIFFLDPTIIKRTLPVAEKLVKYRKKPIRLASCIGWGVLIRYLLGTLSLENAEEAVSKMIGIRGTVIVSPYPEVGIDVDKDSDLELARKLLCS
ncbi:MAG: 4-diphosphocytidyl-2C-methyl-D-erythritol kinase [Firmicutes bacterium HGW-Firmicutes-12]|nr:MAG: 4-diphosphocytidyl-2C-methyl-D-erythritol kinase [Firmicutes bacterium HGW-Firmicutes-12]